jgi:hypothetical protein
MNCSQPRNDASYVSSDQATTKLSYFHSATAPTLEASQRVAYARQGSLTVVRENVNALQLEQVREGMVEMGVPRGLAEQLAQDDVRIGKRIYLLDNSGSMNASDGNMLSDGGAGRIVSRPCTRWEEICSFAEDHARWNLAVGTPCEFMLLNSLGRGPSVVPQEGRDFVTIDRSAGDDSGQMRSLDMLLKNNGPRGVTPIAERLEEIRLRLHAEAEELARRQQMVFLTIATDGLPTSPWSGQSTSRDQEEMVSALRRLCAELPVQLVIRLCTDEDSTVAFYNKIDDELELPLDILDDFASEAKEISDKGNGFFAYTPLLHRIREAGTLCKLLDNLDETQFTPRDARKMVELLSNDATPLRGGTDRQFIQRVEKMLASAKPVYDPVKQRMTPSVNVNRLRVTMKVGFRGNVLPVICPCMAL